MAAQASIKIRKSFSKNGAVRYFSNRYHFTNGAPSDATHWNTLANAIIAAEKLIYTSAIQIVEAVGYAPGSDVPVWSSSESTNGTYSTTTGDYLMPADCAALGKWLTDQRSSKNHPIYLYSYWHGPIGNTSLNHDQITAGQRGAYDNYQQAWVDGFSDGTVTHKRCGPNGAVGYDYDAPNPKYVTHRDFPR